MKEIQLKEIQGLLMVLKSYYNRLVTFETGCREGTNFVQSWHIQQKLEMVAHSASSKIAKVCE